MACRKIRDNGQHETELKSREAKEVMMKYLIYVLRVGFVLIFWVTKEL